MTAAQLRATEEEREDLRRRPEHAFEEIRQLRERIIESVGTGVSTKGMSEPGSFNSVTFILVATYALLLMYGGRLLDIIERLVTRDHPQQVEARRRATLRRYLRSPEFWVYGACAPGRSAPPGLRFLRSPSCSTHSRATTGREFGFEDVEESANGFLSENLTVYRSGASTRSIARSMYALGLPFGVAKRFTE